MTDTCESLDTQDQFQITDTELQWIFQLELSREKLMGDSPGLLNLFKVSITNRLQSEIQSSSARELIYQRGGNDAQKAMTYQLVVEELWFLSNH